MTNAVVTVTFGEFSASFELDGRELSRTLDGSGYLSNASREFVADEVERLLCESEEP